ncbi:MAG: hypothetical protein ACI9OU_001852 [Candidatus Promineifilaceae bacterium]|jgi:hypothetical protein
MTFTIWVVAYILVGVAEADGRPVLPPAGIDLSRVNAIQKEILSLGHSAMQPQYHPIIVPEVLDGKHVLVICAPGGPTRPYRAKLGLGKDGKNWGYFIRKGSSTVRARKPDETELLSLAASIPFDDRIDFDEDHTFFMCRLPVQPQATMPERLAEQVDLEDAPKAKSGPESGQSQFFLEFSCC